jgi:O-antigen/teichoic acid export membrane protein
VIKINQIIIKVKELTIENSFNKDILIVAFGTIFAQFITILISPLLTRLYTPEDFGIYGAYMSIVVICLTIASARYDLAIFIPKNFEDSKRILIISLLLSCIFSCLLLFIMMIFKNQLIIHFNLKAIEKWFLTIPVLVFLLSINQIYLHWLNKVKNYKSLNIYRIINSLIISFFNLIFGFLKFTTNGLILSIIFTQSIIAFFSLQNIKTFFKLYNFKRLIILATRYKNFPLYSLPSTLSGDIGAQMPTILLAYYFNVDIVGYYLLASKIITLPFSVIGNSISTVYKQTAIEEFNLTGNCEKLYIKTLKKLFIISIIPVLILMFGSSIIFTFVFGVKWKIAGTMASYLSVLAFFQLLSTPMADTILFINAQKIDLLLQFGRLLFSILSFVVGGYFKSYELSIILFTITYSIYYISHSLIQFKIAKGFKF